MIQQTSLDAFTSLIREGKINANQTIILDVFKAHDPMPLSNSDIARILGWGINRVTPRVLELRRLGRLVGVMVKQDIVSGRSCMAYALPSTIRAYDHYEENNNEASV